MHVRALLCFGILVTGSSAWASPWTLPKDEMSLSLSYDFQRATHEFMVDGTRQEFPLDAEYQGHTLGLGVRYGLTSRLELEVDLQLKSVAYLSKSVIVGIPTDTVDLAGARAAVLDFTASEVGAGDIFLAARYNLARSAVGSISTETRAKFPTGYRAPGQTFRDPSAPSGDSIEDDLSLGDGQSDIEQSVLFGVYAAATRTFGRAGVGARLRFGGPGHQAIADAKVGQYVGQNVLLFGGVRGAYTLLEGDSLGLTFVATRNNVTPENIRPTDIRQDPLRLDKDYVQTEGGLILLISERVEVQGVYSYIPAGKNIPSIHSFAVSTTIRIPDLTAEEE